jgi:ABC-type bacteriocin/lantibiotic exporter with double-glycine peptidase domain
LQGAIAVENVSFRYSPRAELVLHDISVAIQPGEKIALIGPVGQGKSTLARLLLGLYTPDRGTIRFDGCDLRELDLTALRRQVGVVAQESFLFNDTIRYNIALNDPSIPLERMREAARIACIDDVIERLPLGYDTIVGENGRNLSGGERQRLAIARALAHQPAILLLDEATSALDEATEKRVHQNLSARRCTRILIAHRMQTIADAYRVLVLMQGRIAMQGTYDEIRRGGWLERLRSAADA